MVNIDGQYWFQTRKSVKIPCREPFWSLTFVRFPDDGSINAILGEEMEGGHIFQGLSDTLAISGTLWLTYIYMVEVF